MKIKPLVISATIIMLFTAIPASFLKSETQTVETPKVKVSKVKKTKPQKPKKKIKPTCVSEIKKYNWHIPTAVAVMNVESGGDYTIVNDNPATGDYSIGCFQVNIKGALAYNRPTEKELKKPEVNVAFAYGLYRDVGWCSTAGWYNTCKKLGIM